MPTVSTTSFYSAPMTPSGPDDGWTIDAVSRPGEIIRNFRRAPVRTAVTDLRGTGDRPTLDDAGFELVQAPTEVDQHDLAVRSPTALDRYREETRALLQARTGADDVVIFDATLRREDTTGSRDDDTPNQAPHLRVHVDQSPRGALARAQRHAAGRTYRRFRIINVWRPLLGPVRNYPLALCDYRSVDPAADLVVTRLEFPPWLTDRENYSVKYSPRHRWYYWDSLLPDEAVVFTCYDSASRSLALASGEHLSGDLHQVAGACPHTAFVVPGAPTTGRLRTSLEVRALVLHS